MAIDFSTVQTVTTAEIRKAAMYCLARGCFGVQMSLGKQTITFLSADDCIKRIRFCDEIDAAVDTESAGGIALVQYGEHR